MASVTQITVFKNEPTSIIDTFSHTFRLAALRYSYIYLMYES